MLGFDEFCKIIDMILARFLPARKWPIETLRTWVTWAVANEFLITARNSQGEIAGIAIARPVNLPVVDNSVEFNNKGNTIYLDLVIAPSRNVLRSLGFGILGRFGQRPFVAFKHKEKPKKHLTSHAYKALLKIKHHH